MLALDLRLETHYDKSQRQDAQPARFLLRPFGLLLDSGMQPTGAIPPPDFRLLVQECSSLEKRLKVDQTGIWFAFTSSPSRSTPITPLRDPPVSAPSLRNSDRRLDKPASPFGFRLLPAYRGQLKKRNITYVKAFQESSD